ncbi:Zonular occludens toxin (Zot) [Marinobacter persicus]|uniref:Zonular occludens toxin (Zot) n=1 Tax=Marinobacter persicus TaxID=930118 RepID=A0A1I3UI56_9GAMM|nr:zonular occludens toxin domain-containing protein [Marinobacter persicus]GHD52511.1 hypothetical protein GCM10008110_25410 [Marinobacter persicus]SFJ82373.1 Zonular occludens toxin (Zot) [Marinobacter persicus]
MAVYFVTGKLGSGKTLAAVGKIKDKLIEGRPVATNLDLRLNKLVGPKAKKTVVYRLPDKPTVHDMKAIGSGNETYEEEKNGLIVLDECGTWFNSRDWQDKDRRPLIDWLLHARKLGWDIIFIIQDVSMIDKQARKSVGEHVVYCRRLDRLKVPFIDSLYRFVFSKDMPKAKAHLGIVKYGDLPNSLTVDRWWYMARDLYPAYDTKQAFTDDYPHGIYQVLPPWYTHGRYAVKKDLRFYMRMTRIYLKRFSKVVVLAGGIVAGAAIASVMQPEPVPQPEPTDTGQTSGATEQQPDQDKPETSIAEAFDQDDKPQTLEQKFDGFVISGVAQEADGTPIYVLLSNGEKKYNLDNLRAAGHVVRMVSRCELLIMDQAREQSVRLHTSYCPPSDPPETPPRMSEEQLKKYWLSERMAERDAAP